MQPVRPNRPWTDFPETFEYTAYTEKFDEEIEAAELCDLDDLDADCVALPQPPRAAAALSVGVRRALVTARRRVRSGLRRTDERII